VAVRWEAEDANRHRGSHHKLEEALLYTVALLFHIMAGSLALLSGAAALSFRKGSPNHARAGTVFACAMIVMAALGAAMAAAKGERETAAVAILTFYFVITGWRTARQRNPRATLSERGTFLVPASCAIVLFLFGVDAVEHPRPEVPAAGLFIFAAVSLLPAALDLNFMLRRSLSGSQRIARHLWRMCMALLFACFSFFQGQAQVFPEPVQRSLLLFLPTLAAFAIMMFWVVRLRFSKKVNAMIKRGLRRRPAPVADTGQDAGNAGRA